MRASAQIDSTIQSAIKEQLCVISLYGLDRRGVTTPPEVPAVDVYLLSFVLHDWDDDAARILRTIRRSAALGSRLLVGCDAGRRHAAPDEAGRPDHARRHGRPGTTADEFTDLLVAGGFHLDQIISRPSPFSIIEAIPL